MREDLGGFQLAGKSLVRSGKGSLVVTRHEVLLFSNDDKPVLVTRHHDLLVKLLINTEEVIRWDTLVERVEGPITVKEEAMLLLLNIGLVDIMPDSANCALSPSSLREPPLCTKIVLCISGALQAAAVLPTVLALKECAEQPLHVVTTRTAESFISARALASIGIEVWSTRRVSRKIASAAHMEVARGASIFVVLPASASTIYRLASGACSDLLSLSVAASDSCPVIICPSMNPIMLRYAPINRNLEYLREIGMYIVLPGQGRSASSGLKQTAYSGVGMTPSTTRRLLEGILAAHRVRSRRERSDEESGRE